MIDLRGKRLFAGNKEIQKAYLGSESFLGADEPLEVPNSRIRRDKYSAFLANGAVESYGKLDFVLDNYLVGESELKSNGLYIQNGSFIEYKHSRALCSTYDITIKNDFNHLEDGEGVDVISAYTSLTTSTVRFRIFKKDGELRYQAVVDNSNRTEGALPTTPILTIAILVYNDKYGAYHDSDETVYLNGEEVGNISNSMDRSGYSYQKYGVTISGGITLYDISMGDDTPSVSRRTYRDTYPQMQQEMLNINFK